MQHSLLALCVVSLLAAGSVRAASLTLAPQDSTAQADALLLVQATAATEARQPARKPDIHFVPTPDAVIDEMLTTAKVTKGDLVYDLGCGDGRIVIAAVQRGARGIGIDLDPKRIEEAEMRAAEAGVADRVKFMEGDIFKADFKDATVIALYLLTTINEKLRPKILAETKPGTRVVSHAFSMGKWEADEYKVVDNKGVYYWVVPAMIQGQWINASGAPFSKLTLEQTFQKVAGTAEIGGKTRAITKGKMIGTAFELEVESEADQPPVLLTGNFANGKLTGKAANGAEWTATLDAKGGQSAAAVR